MPDQPLTAQDAQILRYATETFAKIAVANAIWLTGEQLAQRDEKRADFFRMKNTFGRCVDLMKALPCSIVCLKRDGIAYFYALSDSGLTTEKAYLSSL
jgi:hypothetical protein